jgi:hypothetical protein
MNIWSLDKQHTIKHLLLRLEKHFGKDAFHLVEPKETNQLSVRITPPDESMTVYIYCYGQRSGHYGVHFEFPTTVGTAVTQDEEIYDDVPFARLIDMLSLYLYPQ